MEIMRAKVSKEPASRDRICIHTHCDETNQ
jgi:hypothetical protein